MFCFTAMYTAVKLLSPHSTLPNEVLNLVTQSILDSYSLSLKNSHRVEYASSGPSVCLKPLN